MSRLALAFFCCTILASNVLWAQVGDLRVSKAWRQEIVEQNHWKLVGAVEVEADENKFYADEVEIFTDKDLLIATGNVLLTSGSNRIAADRVEFNTKTKTGTFFNASGTATLSDKAVDKDMFGTQEPEIYFYGEKLEKIAPKRYKITRGGFSTCVQPTPRWEATSGTAILNLEHYALLTNTVFKVKGVPVLYMPVFYYPMKRDDRATGFLIPSYGTSTIRGQTLSNAFFWAINSSQDATFLHDFYSKTGQGMGGEYRYVQGPASQGNARVYLLNERPTVSTVASGTGTTRVVQPGRRSFQIRGSSSQQLPHNFVARGNVDYFSNITVQQTYHTDIYSASQRTRTYGGNVAGTWRSNSISGVFNRVETFFGNTQSTVTGAAPRITFNRGTRPLFGLPVYFQIGGEYASLLRSSHDSVRSIDSGVSRIDVNPHLSAAFTKWPFLTVSSALTPHFTYWTRSRDSSGNIVDAGIMRRYYDLSSQITGPVFTKIFNTPNSGYAEKFKHIIEPTFVIGRTTLIDNTNRIIVLEGTDSVVGGTTRITYGVSNRILAKLRDASRGSPEIITVNITQSRYSDARASQFDRQYRSSFSGTPPSRYSPVAIAARYNASTEVNAAFNMEIDARYRAIRTMGASGTVRVGGWLQTAAGWSQKRYIKELPGFNDRNQLTHSLNQSSTFRTKNNRIGGIYAFNFDVIKKAFLQQRFIGYYNAQCCGFVMEYQAFNFGSASAAQDHRFNFSFTLAGIGTFSNFFGALGGAPGR